MSNDRIQQMANYLNAGNDNRANMIGSLTPYEAVRGLKSRAASLRAIIANADKATEELDRIEKMLAAIGEDKTS